jgi:hypothetical protein
MFKVQVSGLHWYLNKFASTPYVISDAMSETAWEIENLIPGIVKDTFAEAAAAAGPAFPDVYLSALHTVIDTQRMGVLTGGMMYFNVLFTFAALGDYGDLMEGFHYRARLADGSLSTLPYEGAELKNPILKRYAAWLKLPGDMREDTYEARAMYWLSQNKAPQWLLLNNGQTLYSPVIPPYPVIEQVNTKLASMAYDIMRRKLDAKLVPHWEGAYKPIGGYDGSNFSLPPSKYTSGSRSYGTFTQHNNLEYIQDTKTGRFLGSRRRY